jgi:hypothetical protein
VLLKLKSAIVAVAVGALCTLGAWAQEWKDRAEYDLVVESINKEQNPKTKLGLLNQWKEKYPATQFKDLRHNLYVTTYQQLGDGKGMKAAALDWLKDNPKAIVAYYWLNLLTISLNDTSADALATGDRAGKGLLSILDESFDAGKKPENVSAADWSAQKVTMAAIANKTLGWVAMQRNENEPAEKFFLESLKSAPNDAAVSLWAGTVIAKQRQLEKQSAALFHFIRAGSREGEGALPPEQKKQIIAYYEKSYVNFHGDRGGLPEIVEIAKSRSLPPDGFKIESKDEILIKQEEELKRTQPVLALWVGIKRELSGANGPAYFENFKGTLVPGGVEVGVTKVEKFKGTVVSSTPERRPKEVVLGMSAPDMSEVTIRLETPMPNPVTPGTELEFSGVPVEYTADPFMLVFEVENADLLGWPKPEPPVRKAAPKRAKKK